MKKLKKFFTTMLLFVFTFIMSGIPAMTSLAYTYENTNIDPEMLTWEVVNADTPDLTVKVNMYMMMDPNYVDSAGFRGTYEFGCTDGTFVWDDGTVTNNEWMAFHFRPDNAVVEDIFEDYQVWLWQFTLEPGTYQFAVVNNNIRVLTQDFEYTQEDKEEITVEAGDVVTLYTAFGDPLASNGEQGWLSKPETTETLIRYAKQKSSGGVEIVMPEEEEVPAVEEKADKEEMIEEEPEEAVIPPAVPEEPEKVEDKKVEEIEEKGVNLAVIVICLGAVAVIGIVGFTVYKKYKK